MSNITPETIEYLKSKGYRAVYYIESTGTQYIDTGVYPDSTTILQFEFINKLVTGDVIIGHTPIDTVEADVFRFFNATSKAYLDYGSGWEHNRIYGGAINASVLYELEIGNRYVKNIKNGQTIVSGSSVSFQRKSYTIMVNGDNNYSQNIWYYLKIYDNDVLARDYYPCYNISTGEIGLYDMVSDSFFGNNGTGVFLKGADIPDPVYYYGNESAEVLMRRRQNLYQISPSYITDGLIFRLDGKNKRNDGYFRWMDFIRGYNFTGSGVEEIENGFRFNGGTDFNNMLTCGHSFSWGSLDKRTITYEFVVKNIRGWSHVFMSDKWADDNSQAIWVNYELPNTFSCAFATAQSIDRDRNYQFKTVASQEITLSMSQKDGGFVVVNGNKITSHYGLDNGTSNSDYQFHIGGRYVNSSQCTIGQFELYEVRIYNRTLSDAEILQNQMADRIKYNLHF